MEITNRHMCYGILNAFVIHPDNKISPTIYPKTNTLTLIPPFKFQPLNRRKIRLHLHIALPTHKQMPSEIQGNQDNLVYFHYDVLRKCLKIESKPIHFQRELIEFRRMNLHIHI